MRILHRGLNQYEVLKRLLLPVATQLQFAVILPLAALIVVCYPFLSSMLRPHQPHILVHDAHIQPNSSVLHIRQAIVVPPIFVSAKDAQILQLVQPLHDLSASLTDPAGPQLYSIFNAETPEVSMYVGSNSRNAQGLLFTYVYYSSQEAQLWEAALAQMSDQPLPKAPFNFANRRDLKEALLSTASSAHFSLWPGVGVLSQTGAWLSTFLLLGWTLCLICSSDLHRPKFVMGSLLVRIVLCGFASLSIISIFFPALDMLIVYRFAAVALIPIHMSSSSAARVCAAAQDPNPPTAFNRLLNAYHRSFSWINVIGVPTVLGGICLVLAWGKDQRSLVPLTALLCIYSMIDTFIHFTLFAAVLYIDMVSSEHLTLDNSRQDKCWLVRRIKETNVMCLLQALASNLHLEATMPIGSALVLHLYGYRFLNRIHPHIEHTVEKPSYIQIFIDPLSSLLQDYAVLQVFRPLVFQVNGYFDKPSASLDFAFTTLRYGNTLSLILETFCLLIFVSSICMVALILATDRDHLNVNVQEFLFSRRREQFSEWTINVGAALDIVQLKTQNNHIASLSLDGQFSLVDASTMCQAPVSLLSLLNIDSPWGVRQILLNVPKGMAGLLSSRVVHMWDTQTSQKIYEVSLPTARTPKFVGWIERDLVLFLENGSVVEVYTDRQPRIIPIHSRPLAWVCSCEAESVVVMCDVDNKLLVTTRVARGEWSMFDVLLGEAFLAQQRPVPATIPSCLTGNLQHHMTPWVLPFEGNDKFLTAIMINDIKTKLVVTDRRAMLVDINTTVVIRYLPQIRAKPGTLRVYHSQPQYCVFCGFVAIANLTVAYEQEDVPGMLVCETYQVENRSRSKICLRVERGPNETRCHGFMTASCSRVTVPNVECWDVLGINMIIGVRQRGKDREGFTYSANGLVSSFPLDEQLLEGQLLTSALGPTAQLSATSVCVVFGNMIKVFYQQT